MSKTVVPPKSDLAALGAAVRGLRLERGYSQERLSLEAGLHRNYVGRVERGELSPTFEPLLAISRALGVEPDELMRLFLRAQR
jgi:transcriptional regulator with XRE-family HTH domain